MDWFKCTDPSLKSNKMDSVKANTIKLYGTALEEECTGYMYATYPRSVIVTIAQSKQFIAYSNDSQGSREVLDKIQTMNNAFTFLTVGNIQSNQGMNCLSSNNLMAHRTWSPIPKVGLTVYLLGYSTRSTNLTITKGTLTDTTSFDSWFVTISSHKSSNADSIGWSGGPVVNKNGQLVGIIEQTCGDWVKIVPAHYLYTVATLIADSKST
jgi:hypothetical protein